MTRGQLQALATALVRRLKVGASSADAKIGIAEIKAAIGALELSMPDQEDIDKIAEQLGDLLGQCHVYAFPKADVTTDVVVFGLDLDRTRLGVLLIERGRPGEPFQGHWALPGGFLDMDEDLAACAWRELQEETRLDLSNIEQLQTFGQPGRDPRGRVLTIAYWGVVRSDRVSVSGADDARQARWFDVDRLPALAFDHADIIDAAIHRLRNDLTWRPVGVWLLPEPFTGNELQRMYETILGHRLDAHEFQLRLEALIEQGVIEAAYADQRSNTDASEVCYRYREEAYRQLTREGIGFSGPSGDGQS